MFKLRMLSATEFKQAEEARYHLAKTRTDGLQGASMFEVTGPNVGWYCPWYFDPADPEKWPRRDAALKALREGKFGKGDFNYYLSRFYWEKWAMIRPPISVICPNGEEWCIDARSSNGEGWQVSMTDDKITANPSIACKGYHGWLKDGEFTKDCERPDAPAGIYPYGNRKPGNMFG